MIPQTATGWIVFAAMWLSRPIAGYSASDQVDTVQERGAVERRDALMVGVFGGLLLVFVEG